MNKNKIEKNNKLNNKTFFFIFVIVSKKISKINDIYNILKIISIKMLIIIIFYKLIIKKRNNELNEYYIQFIIIINKEFIFVIKNFDLKIAFINNKKKFICRDYFYFNFNYTSLNKKVK